MTRRLYDDLAEVYDRIRQDIFAFCQEMNFEPTPQQAKFLQAVQEGSDKTNPDRKRMIAVKSGRGPGKTAGTAIAGMWRALCAHQALTIVSAPTLRQVKDIHFAELKRWRQRANSWVRKISEIQATKMTICKDRIWGSWGITASNADNLRGLHQDNMTFIFDEASGVPTDIWNVALASMTHEDALIIAIGNPSRREGEFFRCFNQDRSLWNTMTWNAEESPMVSAASLERMRKRYGRDSDEYRIEVLGEFPWKTPNTVMSSEDLEKCTRTDRLALAQAPQRYSSSMRPARQFGIDLARFGGDESVIYQRMGNSVLKWERFSHREPLEVIQEAFKWQTDANWSNQDCVYVVDAGGMGQGVLGYLYQNKKQVMEFHNGGKAYDAAYGNLVSEAYFELAHLVEERRVWIPADDMLIEQLCSRLYEMKDVKGQARITLEPKEEYRKRAETERGKGWSPDRADALVMAFWDKPAWASQVISKAPSRGSLSVSR